MSIPIAPEHRSAPTIRPLLPATSSQRSSMSTTLFIELWAVERLSPYDRSLRKNDRAVERMIASIHAYGFAIPLLVSADGAIIDGHLRFKAAHKLGFTEVPVIVCDDWSPEQIQAFRLMVNRSASWAEWDPEALAR